MSAETSGRIAAQEVSDHFPIELTLCLPAPALPPVELVAATGATVLSSTSRPTTVDHVIDGDTSTFWQSGACFPSGWVTSAANALLGACAAGLCTASDESQDLTAITDGNMAYTTVWVTPLQSTSAAWVRMVVPRGPQPLRRLKMRGRFYSNATVSAITGDGVHHVLGMMTPETQYDEVWFDFPEGMLTAELEVRVVSELRPEMGGWCYGWTGDCLKFLLHDMAALAGDCFEEVKIDFHEPVSMTSIWTRLTGHGAFHSLTMSTSLDDSSYTPVVELDNTPTMEIDSPLSDGPRTARYLSLRWLMQEADWQKVSLWEVLVEGHQLTGSQTDLVELLCPNSCGNGRCDHTTDPSAPVCVCDDGFAGQDCSELFCAVSCGAHGTCTDGACVCDLAYSGTVCDTALCPFDCWEHGVCEGGSCICTADYTGSDCRYSADASGQRFLSYPMLTGVQPDPPDACPVATPVTCADGTCAVSVGKCAVDSLTDEQRTALPAREAELGARTAVPLTASISGVSVDVSSNPATADKVIDGNDGSGGFWQSGMCSAAGPCTQSATVDLTSPQAVGALYIKASTWNDLIDTTVFEHSLDGVGWTLLDDTVPAGSHGIDISLSPAVEMRFIRVSHHLSEGGSSTVYVWEISAWDADGKYGALPAARASSVSLSSLVGVNGIWGWQTNGYSTSVGHGEGPQRYSNLAAHGRNYHNWHWDVADPDTPPPFDDMVSRAETHRGARPGHSSKLRQDWLNWDHEYAAWMSAGLEVQVAIQFVADQFPRDTFDDPYTSAYNYGYAFARHFGPTHGTGNVHVLEVGNEP